MLVEGKVMVPKRAEAEDGSEAMKSGLTKRTASFVWVSADLISSNHREPGVICSSDQSADRTIQIPQMRFEVRLEHLQPLLVFVAVTDKDLVSRHFVPLSVQFKSLSEKSRFGCKPSGH